MHMWSVVNHGVATVDGAVDRLPSAIGIGGQDVLLEYLTQLKSCRITSNDIVRPQFSPNGETVETITLFERFIATIEHARDIGLLLTKVVEHHIVGGQDVEVVVAAAQKNERGSGCQYCA